MITWHVLWNAAICIPVWLTQPKFRKEKIASVIALICYCSRSNVISELKHPSQSALATTFGDTTFDLLWFPTLAYHAFSASLRDPSLIFSACVVPYVLFAFMALCFHFYASAALNRFSPMYFRHLIDGLFPPETIYHSFRDAEGYQKLDARKIRDKFKPDQFMLDRAYLSKDATQPHPKAAQRRLAACNMIEAFCKRNGLHHFDDEMSNRNAMRNVDGTRVIADAKDAWSYTADQLKYDTLKTGLGATLISHIDTFTHKSESDANHTLSNGHIHALYTWNPSTVAGNSDESSFRYDEEGNFITSGVGSADYVDQLWDFEGDGLVTTSYEYSMTRFAKFCLSLAFVIYAYNVYCNFIDNSELSPYWGGHWKWFEYHQYYPVLVWHIFGHTNAGIIAAMCHYSANFGLPVGWLAVFNGWPYPSFDWHSFVVSYPWDAEPTFLTPTHWLVITSLVLIAAYDVRQCTLYCHRVLRIDVGEHRSVVMIVPNTKFKGLSATLRPFLLDAALKRRKPRVFKTAGGHIALAEKYKQQGSKPAHHYAAFLGSFQAHLISDAASDTTKALTTAKSDPSLSNVRVSTKAEGDEVTRNAAALTIALNHLESKPYDEPQLTYSYRHVPTIVRQETEEAADNVPVKDVQAHRAMTPIITGCDFVHAKSRGACADTVKRRLRDPADKVKGYKMTPEFAGFVREFADHIKCDVLGGTTADHTSGSLELYDEARYVEERNKNQLRKYQEVQDVYDIMNVEERAGFLKREVLAKPYKAARPICTFAPEQQAIGGRIALAYAEALKACKWVGCGQNPSEITESVLRVCANKGQINATDFTAQDATVSEIDRQIELFLLKQLFHEDHHEIIENWHWTDYCGCVLYGDPGTKRVTHEFEGSRGSGSPFTTYGNTPLTGLYAYIALRKDGHDSVEAYSKLGVYSGDDGITADVSAAACAQAAEIMGFIIKSEISETNIPYLGRIFYDPIHGSPSSIQDPMRTLGKLATTLVDTDTVTAHESMLLKAMCLQVTDRNSDFFGEWSKKMLEDAGKQQTQALNSKLLGFQNLHPYFAITGLKTNTTFVNHKGDFEDLFETQMPGFDWCKFNAWVKHGKGQCPTLWSKPEPTDEEMMEVAPVAIAWEGVEDTANTTTYEKPEQYSFGLPKEVADRFPNDDKATPGSEIFPPKPTPGEPKDDKKKKRRTTKEHKELIEDLRKAGLLEEYSAARKDDSLPQEVNAERAKTRRRLELEVRTSLSKQ